MIIIFENLNIIFCEFSVRVVIDFDATMHRYIRLTLNNFFTLKMIIIYVFTDQILSAETMESLLNSLAGKIDCNFCKNYFEHK